MILIKKLYSHKVCYKPSTNMIFFFFFFKFKLTRMTYDRPLDWTIPNQQV